jgi:hypothetical protein
MPRIEKLQSTNVTNARMLSVLRPVGPGGTPTTDSSSAPALRTLFFLRNDVQEPARWRQSAVSATALWLHHS